MAEIFDRNTLQQAADWLSEALGEKWSEISIINRGARGDIQLLAIVPGWKVCGVGELQFVEAQTGNALSNFVSDGLVALDASRIKSLLDRGSASLEWLKLDVMGATAQPVNRELRAVEAPDIDLTHVRVSASELRRIVSELQNRPIQTNDEERDSDRDYDQECAELFDPVHYTTLENMFPANGRWKKWCEQPTKRPKLNKARQGRGFYNPYLAARFYHDQGGMGWTWARCCRVLANSLPSRSKGYESKLTGDFE